MTVVVALDPVAATAPRDAERTRARILKAAMALFAERGYAASGVRDIAERASANPALVLRYFGSKESLFRAALEQALEMGPVLAMDPRRLGRGIVDLFIDTQGFPSPLAMAILSASDPHARAAAVDALERRVIAPLAQYLGPPDAEGRAARLNLLWSGFLIAWKLLPISPLAGDGLASTRLWLEKATQAIVDEGRAETAKPTDAAASMTT